MKDKKRKYNVGDIVSLKGYNENFEITEWFFEASYHLEEGYYERSSYTMRGQKTGKFLDFINEEDEDLKIVKSAYESDNTEDKDNDGEEEVLEEVILLDTFNKPLTSDEIDFLLDKYNDYMNTHLLIKHLGFDEVEYKDMADQIIKYLTDN